VEESKKENGQWGEKIMKIFSDEFKWELKMFLMKVRYPKAGYWERCCLAAGYTKKTIDTMVEEAIKDGWIEKNDRFGREEVCKNGLRMIVKF
jgi:hypothetical protein